MGGSCAQPIVVREALRALADGQPRLLRISKEPRSDSRRGDGIVDEVMTCHSGGTLEIAVEPVLPAPALWIAGTTPIAGALAGLGAAAGFAVTVVDPLADAETFPTASAIVAEADLASLGDAHCAYVVVATQGQWDEEAVAAALGRDVAYVGLVASPTRAATVRAYLHDEGMPAERIAALRAPAGLDLGAETAEEVAVSILAELVQVRRGRAAFVASPGPATLAGTRDPATVPGTAAGALAQATALSDIVLLDPVCGMTVDREYARHLAEHGGVIHAFCSVGCRARFMKDPAAYLPATASSNA